jgi:hypothetical protein
VSPLLSLLAFGTQKSAANDLHAEDARVIETALIRYWRLDEPGEPIYLLDHTFGPFGNSREATVGLNDRPFEGISPSIRKSLDARNRAKTSIEWMRPKNRRLLLAAKFESSNEGPEGYRQYAWTLLPGYSSNRLEAVVCFGFNYFIHPPGQATMWLSKRKGVWKVVRQEARIIV